MSSQVFDPNNRKWFALFSGKLFLDLHNRSSDLELRAIVQFRLTRQSIDNFLLQKHAAYASSGWPLT